MSDKAESYREPENGSESENLVLEVRLDGTVAAYFDTRAEKTLASAPLSALILEALDSRLLALEGDGVDLTTLESELVRGLEDVRQTILRRTMIR